MGAAMVFVTLPLGIALGSWLGAKLGARAVLRLLFPFPTILWHTSVLRDQGALAAAEQAAASLASVPTVFAWAVAFFQLSRRTTSPWRAMAGATGFSTLLTVASEPAIAALGPAARMALALGLVAAAHLAMREPGPSLPAPVSPGNLAGRLLSILAILVTLALLAGREGAVAAGLRATLMSFPRMTMELTLGTWIAAGAPAARQALAGLPIGLCAALTWCAALLWLPTGGAWLGGLGAACVTGALAFGVTRGR